MLDVDHFEQCHVPTMASTPRPWSAPRQTRRVDNYQLASI
jgi:hypothetical protein